MYLIEIINSERTCKHKYTCAHVKICNEIQVEMIK